MPAPPRMLVLAFPKTSQAKPARGAKFVLSGKFAPVGAPLSPEKSRPAARRGKLSMLAGDEAERPALRVVFWLLYS